MTGRVYLLSLPNELFLQPRSDRRKQFAQTNQRLVLGEGVGKEIISGEWGGIENGDGEWGVGRGRGGR